MFRGDVEPERVKIAFIPQHDVFIPVLTVRECIVFASKLQNAIKYLKLAYISRKNFKPNAVF